MTRAAGKAIVALTGLLVVLAGCSEVEITGRKQLNLIPDSIINSMSLQQYGQFISGSKVSADAQKTAMVKRVGSRIVQAVEEYSRKNLPQGQRHDRSVEGDRPRVGLLIGEGHRVGHDDAESRSDPEARAVERAPRGPRPPDWSP